MALLAGIALRAVSLQGLHAQATPPTYAVIDVSSITDPSGYNAIGPKGGPSEIAFGGQFIARTENIAASDVSGAEGARKVVDPKLRRGNSDPPNAPGPAVVEEICHGSNRRHPRGYPAPA